MATSWSRDRDPTSRLSLQKDRNGGREGREEKAEEGRERMGGKGREDIGREEEDKTGKKLCLYHKCNAYQESQQTSIHISLAVT